MDPQQRLLLEVAYEALENAGMATTTARRGKTGVFIGITNNDYARILTSNEDYNAIGAYHISGNHANAAAGRISYLLNLNGPSLAVDTACSSYLSRCSSRLSFLTFPECRQALVGRSELSFNSRSRHRLVPQSDVRPPMANAKPLTKVPMGLG
jgi:microcystin synthetase protein McyD